MLNAANIQIYLETFGFLPMTTCRLSRVWITNFKIVINKICFINLDSTHIKFSSYTELASANVLEKKNLVGPTLTILCIIFGRHPSNRPACPISIIIFFFYLTIFFWPPHSYTLRHTETERAVIVLQVILSRYE